MSEEKEIIKIFPEEAIWNDSSQWPTKRLNALHTRGEFKAFPFLGVIPANSTYPPPEIGLGLVWVDGMERKTEFVGFVVDKSWHPTIFSVEHLLRAFRALFLVENADFFNRRANTIGYCWGIAQQSIDREWELTLCTWFGKGTFEELRQSIFEYHPSENDKSLLHIALSKYGIPHTR